MKTCGYHNQKMVAQNISLDPNELFRGLYEPRWSKTLAVFMSFIFTALGILLFYSIIWFEGHGSDLKRTIQVHKLVTWNKGYK